MRPTATERLTTGTAMAAAASRECTKRRRSLTPPTAAQPADCVVLMEAWLC